ncbi:hypothetical protein [Chryseobacterium sp. HSC-36S06]|uniref:hypothetical protein n=1 Tax=Chryseobacterium sp. HSC-36S06 TaxID=2910970 RepID=UPI00209FBFD2|nr:hypothetical protein [Chryseobacterium sp. HSC-36S06]MCP2037330.1 hypothetical protein [Chryseobacterium sp. HSC-36S06]
MNRQTAIGLIVGCIFALLTALITSETKYYNFYSNGKSEIEYAKYKDFKEKYGTDTLSKKKDINTTLVGLIFLGGLGLGYLFSDKIEDKANELYRKYKDKQKAST